MAVGDGLPILLRLLGRRDRSVVAVSVPRPHTNLSLDRQARLQPHDRHGGRGDPLHERTRRRRARAAVLPLLRDRWNPFAAPAAEGMDRQVQGQVRHWLERPAGRDLRQPEAPGRDPGGYRTHRMAGQSGEVGHAVGGREETVRAAGGSVRGLRGLHGLRDRPGDSGNRGSGKARQHTDHLHLRRQRHEPGRFDARHAERIHGVQRRPGRPCGGAAQALRRLGLSGDLSAHGGSVVVGVRYAVQVDEADSVAFRRHSPGPRDLVARPHQDAGGIRTQFHHIIDIAPTILEAVGVKAPEVVDGIPQKAVEGVSMIYTFPKSNANVASTRTTQYFEMIANRGVYHEGWYANTTPPVPPWVLNAPYPDIKDYKWELYNVNEDYSQANDLAVQMPDKLKEMQALFAQEAEKYNVYPLDNSQFQRAIAPRPSPTAGQTVFTYLGERPGIPLGVAPSILNKSYTITAEVDVPQGGGNGMIVTAGGFNGGYGLYLLNGKPVFNYNMLMLAQFRCEGQQPLAPGKHTIVFDFTYDGPGVAKGGTGVLKVDDADVATLKMPHTIPFLLPVGETFDVGVDTRTGVNDKDYQVPFRFNGKLNELTFKLGPTRLSELDQKTIQEAVAIAND